MRLSSRAVIRSPLDAATWLRSCGALRKEESALANARTQMPDWCEEESVWKCCCARWCLLGNVVAFVVCKLFFCLW